MSILNDCDVAVDELTEEQGAELFDTAAREALGVSGEEFLRKYDQDDLPAEWPADVINRLEFLLPFAR